MLVLSRREGQAIIIGDNVVVRVVEIRGDHVRLGIDAPRSIIIHREEVAEEIKAENQAARLSKSFDMASLPLPKPPAQAPPAASRTTSTAARPTSEK